MSKLTYAALTAMLCFTAFLFGQGHGETTGFREALAVQQSVNASMRDLGACEWAEAFAREVQCGAEQ